MDIDESHGYWRGYTQQQQVNLVGTLTLRPFYIHTFAMFATGACTIDVVSGMSRNLVPKIKLGRQWRSRFFRSVELQTGWMPQQGCSRYLAFISIIHIHLWRFIDWFCKCISIYLWRCTSMISLCTFMSADFLYKSQLFNEILCNVHIPLFYFI